jgi:Lon protease-like protein
MQQELLPLFPLQVVLFPRGVLPLHIFEERYKEMIGDAIATRSEFGVVLAKDKGIAHIGCTASVTQVLHRYPDGRMDILTEGRRRFEILMLNEEKDYLRAPVHFFDDEETGPLEEDLVRRATEAFRALRDVVRDEAEAELSPEGPQASFLLAQGIPDLDFLQALLQTRSERVRLQQLVQYLDEYIPRRRHIEQVRAIAPRNGRGRHGAPPPDIE